MDLASASRMSGRSGQMIRLGAFVCFLIACGLLIASHAAKPRLQSQGLAKEHLKVLAAW